MKPCMIFFTLATVLLVADAARADTIITTFDNFTSDALYPSWSLPSSTIVSSPTSYSVTATGYGSNYKYIEDPSRQGAGNTLLELTTTLSGPPAADGHLGPIITLIDTDGSRYNFAWYAQFLGPHVLTMPVDSPTWIDAPGTSPGLNLNGLQHMHMQLDPGGFGTAGAYTVEWQHLQLIVPEPPETATWNIDAGGNWSLSANWAGGVPNGTGGEAVLGSVITSPHTVTVDAPITVGRLDFDNANTYTIAGPQVLTLDVTSGDAQINVASGSHTITAPVSLADNTVITVSPAASNLSISGAISAGGITLTKDGVGTLHLNNLRAAGLSLTSGTVAIQPSGGTSVFGHCRSPEPPRPTAKLDLANNSAIVDYPAAGPNPTTTIREQIIAGRGGPGLGKTWNGLGITSSQAAAEPVNSASVGYADNATLPLGPKTEFGGQPVDNSSVLMRYTRTGDANLDGVVNNDDVTIVGANYAPGFAKPHWDLGDFDYNGFVDDDDVTLLGVYYNPAATPIPAPALESGGVAAVPEPTTLVLLAIGLLLACAPRLRGAKQRIP